MTTESNVSSPAPPIKYIYKIAPSTPPPSWPPTSKPDSLTPILPPSPLDTTSQFIHMSTAAQIPGTLARFFASPTHQQNTVFLLKVLWPPVFDELGLLRWETPDAKVGGTREEEGLFPHLYFYDGEDPGPGATRLWLRKGEVEGVREVVSERGVEGWEGALGELGAWLV